MQGAFSRLLIFCLMLGCALDDAVAQNEGHDVVGDTLQEVTVTSRSAQKRMDEVQIGVEKIEVATLAKMPSLFGEKDIIKGIQLLPGVKSENRPKLAFCASRMQKQNVLIFEKRV